MHICLPLETPTTLNLIVPAQEALHFSQQAQIKKGGQLAHPIKNKKYSVQVKNVREFYVLSFTP
ncbi:MAG: hypothetical protein PUP93_10185 [Rhizonema sp. NSF051]|nr:hypothetical protein [Rhizonema sp. NSF051]